MSLLKIRQFNKISVIPLHMNKTLLIFFEIQNNVKIYINNINDKLILI